MVSLLSAAIKGRKKRFLGALADPFVAQRDKLFEIIQANASTSFGREFGFGKIFNIDDYRRQVSIMPYSGFEPYIQRMKRGEDNVLVAQKLKMFGVTSGSSANPKFIPVTSSFTRDNHFAHLIWMHDMLSNHPGSVGKSFSMVSPAEEGKTAGGIPYGSCSGKNYQEQSIPVRCMHPVPYEVFLIGNCASKYHCALVFALGSNLRVVNSVNPSSLVLLAGVLGDTIEGLLDDLSAGEFNNAPGLSQVERLRLSKLLKPQPKRARQLREIFHNQGAIRPLDIWPEISVINTWQGGNAPFYLSKLRELWGEVPMRCLGLRATEGMFSIPLEDNSSSGVLAVCSHFLEFIEGEEEPAPNAKTLLAHQLEIGKRYRLIITTSNGLYRYDLADIVEVTGYNGRTPEVAFLHKAGGVLSLTGEKVCEDQVVEVMARIDKYNFAGFTVTLEMTENPRYVLALESGDDITEDELVETGLRFDRELAKVNVEYAAKRESGRLDEPVVLLLAKGSYRKYRTHLINLGRPDGQVKPPHMLRPPGVGLSPVKGCPFFDVVEVVDRIRCRDNNFKEVIN